MNEGREFVPSEIKKTTEEKLSVDKKIELRFKQNRTEALIEYVTGLKIDDPGLMDKIENDQKEIRSKYGLPNRDFKFDDPEGYERYLRQMAKDNEVEIKSEADFPEFFEKHKLAGGFSSEDGKTIAVDIDKTDDREYLKSLNKFEHEMIHSLQQINTPEMKIEQQEYEAYMVDWNIENLRENKSLLYTAFDFFIGNSVYSYYRQKSEETGIKIEAEYKNPEYFLKNVDGISEEKIKEYKEKHSLDNVRV